MSKFFCGMSCLLLCCSAASAYADCKAATVADIVALVQAALDGAPPPPCTDVTWDARLNGELVTVEASVVAATGQYPLSAGQEWLTLRVVTADGSLVATGIELITAPPFVPLRPQPTTIQVQLVDLPSSDLLLVAPLTEHELTLTVTAPNSPPEAFFGTTADGAWAFTQP